MSETIHVWITKYALTKGVYEVDVEKPDAGSAMVIYRDPNVMMAAVSFHKGEWFASYEEAEAQVRKMIEAKRVSLRKALAKLDALEQKLGEEA